MEKGEFSVEDLENLPKDVIKTIFSSLDAISLCRLAIVNSHFRIISEDDKLWLIVGTRYGYQIASKNEFKKRFLRDHISWPDFRIQKSLFGNAALGNLIFRDRETRILLLGHDEVGKTTFLKAMKMEEGKPLLILMTVGIEQWRRQNVLITSWDFGFSYNTKRLWSRYYTNKHALIWMLDSSDRDHIDGQTEDLFEQLNEVELQDIILLVFANKQDLPNAMSGKEVEERMGLKRLPNNWFVQPCSVKNGEGLYEGLAWLATAIKNKYESLWW